MGDVYLAIDDVLGREVAIKTLRPTNGPPGGLGARMLDERFRHEARAIAQLAHPSIVAVFDVDPAANPPYLVMERVSGPSLKEQFASGPMPIADARAMGIQIANALATAHAVNIVHRDVKPANILVAGPASWKLADFGVAHVPDSSLTLTGQFVGSPAYAPPEALLKGVSSSAGDIYGLGATLFQAVAGRWPRLDSTTSALLAPVPPLLELAPHAPIELAMAIDRALAMEMDQRPTATQLAQMLASHPSREMAAPPAPRPTPMPGFSAVSVAETASYPGGGRHSNRTLYAIIGGLALIVLILIAVVASHGEKSPAIANPAGVPTRIEPEDRTAGSLPTPAVARDEVAGDKWREITEKYDEGDYRELQKKLDEFERDYGASPETDAVRSFLRSLPPGPPKKPKKHGKHDED